MLRSRDFRRRAWASLQPRYWNAFFACIIISLLGGGTSSTFSFNFGSIGGLAGGTDTSTGEFPENEEFWMMFLGIFLGVLAVLSVFVIVWSVFVSAPMNIGLCGFFTKNTRFAPSLLEVFNGFRFSYGRNVVTMLLVGIKTFLWSCLFVIPGIIKSYEYAMIPYILADKPELSTSEAFLWSKKMMSGNKFRLFKLELSFIGWQFLCLFTFGIGFMFLQPYMNAAKAEFFMEVSGLNYMSNENV